MPFDTQIGLRECRFLMRFRSPSIQLSPDLQNDDYLVGAKNLMHWLENYDMWYKDCLGIPNGLRPFALFNREVSLFGENILAIPDKLIILARKAICLGFSISITTPIYELIENFDIASRLCEASLIHSIGIIIEDLDNLDDYDEILKCLIKLINLKRSIAIVGSMNLIRSLGILSLGSINEADIGFYPLPTHEGSIISTDVQNSISPCKNRFRLCISNDGYIYPCFGLLGMVDYALCSVSEPHFEKLLDQRTNKLNLERLSEYGPELSNCRIEERRSPLPWVCERHRSELLH